MALRSTKRKSLTCMVHRTLRGRRAKNMKGAKKKRGARGRETREGTFVCLPLERLSRAPYIFHA